MLDKGLGELYQMRVNKKLMAPGEVPFREQWFDIVQRKNKNLLYRLAEACMVAIYILEQENQSTRVPRKNSTVVDRATIVRSRLASLEPSGSSRKEDKFFPYQRGEYIVEYFPRKPDSAFSRMDASIVHGVEQMNEETLDSIIDYYRLPDVEVAQVDHESKVPGMAYSLGFQVRRTQIRTRARDQLETSYQQFAQGKSFWTIVPRIPDGKEEVVFLDKNGDKIPFYSNEFDQDSDRSFLGAISSPQHKSFGVTRIREGLVITTTDNIDFDVHKLHHFRVPEGYDLIVNPAFFCGRSFLNIAQEDLQFIGKQVKRNGVEVCESYVSTLSEGIAQGFLFIFGYEWDKLVKEVEDKCKNGNDPHGVPWPISLKNETTTPAPAYWDIPRGYWTYAAGLMLGMYRDEAGPARVGVRELWGAAGLRGFYSYVRKNGQPEIMMLFAMLREAVYGCRSTRLGVKLLHKVPFEYHDDFIAFCSLPWSKVKSVDRGRNMNESLDYYSRYQIIVRDPTLRCVMNFAAACGLEFMSIPVPTLIEGHMSVIADAFRDHSEAKRELIWHCEHIPENLLPGAAIRAADPFRDRDGGILNMVQDRDVEGGHVQWMTEFSWTDSLSVQVAIVAATVYGWYYNSGLGHFLLALTVLARVDEEVAVHGTALVLFFGRTYGVHMYQDELAQFLVPVALGAVEGASDNLNFDDPNQLMWFRIILLSSGGLAFFILFFTMLARLRFVDTDGMDYESVLLRDGSIDCLLMGEYGTGFRDGDHHEAPGVGPLQAHNASDSNYDGTAIASATNSSSSHLSGNWVLAGTVNTNRPLEANPMAVQEDDNGYLVWVGKGASDVVHDVIQKFQFRRLRQKLRIASKENDYTSQEDVDEESGRFA